MIKKRFIALAAAAGLALSGIAWAQQAFTTRTANVRAGPERDFPLVATLPPGASVYIAGCLSDYRWCDIDFGGGRGWVSSRSLQSNYGSTVVPLYSYGATLGLPIVTFSLFNYWDSYYRNRPFYRERPRWESRWRESDHQPRYDNNRSRYERRPAPPVIQQPRAEGPRNRPEYRPEQHFNNPVRPPQQLQRPEQPRPAPPPQRGTGRMSNRDSEPSREHQGQ